MVGRGGAAVTDDQLALAGAAGNTWAVEKLWLRHVRAVRGYARNLVGDPDDADDIVSVVAIRYCVSLHTYRPREAGYKAWIMAICRNSAMAFISGTSARGSGANEMLDNVPSADRVEDEAIATTYVDWLIRRIEARCKWPGLLLGFAEGKEYSQLAVEFGVPIGTIKSRISNERARLSP